MDTNKKVIHLYLQSKKLNNIYTVKTNIDLKASDHLPIAGQTYGTLSKNAPLFQAS